jgi:hypothetical protein
MKQISCDSGFLAVTSPSARLVTHLGLGQLVERELETGERRPGQSPQEIGLVLLPVKAAQQPAARGRVLGAHVVPRRDPVAAEQLAEPEHLGELRVGVAAHARLGVRRSRRA